MCTPCVAVQVAGLSGALLCNLGYCCLQERRMCYQAFPNEHRLFLPVCSCCCPLQFAHDMRSSRHAMQQGREAAKPPTPEAGRLGEGQGVERQQLERLG